MAELTTLFYELLDGTVEALAKSESRHLKDDIDAAIRLAASGDTVSAQVMSDLLDKGYIPDFYAAADLDLEAQLTMSTTRERKTSGTGSITYGPLKIEATLGNSLVQGTNTNLTIRCHLQRTSKSAMIDRVLQTVEKTVATVTPPKP